MSFKNIAVVGTGYVGLVTGVALSDIGHSVTCVDIDEKKVELMQSGVSPIYEPGLSELMTKNINAGRLSFTTKHQQAFAGADAIYIAVGTPQKADGTADLRFIEAVADHIAEHLTHYAVVVTKSTVPVGTNDYIKSYIEKNTDVPFDVVSNPEFLREGSAVHDTFHGDRIVIGADSTVAGDLIEEINKPFGIPVFRTDIRSAEMIKYASNAFLATKISFVNEIANLCEKLNANVDDVAKGMGQDKRIGDKFLNAGIGYGGSCFPKDTSALVQIAGNVEHEFTLLKAVIEVNYKQQRLLVEKAREHFGSLRGKTIAMLGLAFKPNTDDMREAASIILAQELILAGARVVAYDPIAMGNARNVLPAAVDYADNAFAAIQGADTAFVVTEWDEICALTPEDFKANLKEPVVFDGRNCFNIETMKEAGLNYYSVGRPVVKTEKELV
ncbi:UDP-glucose 6-dehydrogenase [Niallia circulans]|uniref:UDP-glucose dehydrogenase family protein n=1 Tax=Shouchella clausii TaxID=79880 RepID=UPI000BA65CD7|nr:UDP-glucose/GDP-mannose dehydrogenase family protein [Shouchella clausii]PAD44031.1 UDP-glucose 6-dehydrogenase [Bacillus sp. 7520-S]PAE98479.1 UDP-glucose 6-dehydrogenase [Shouchella clausii]SPT78316.1 UDP-glucose 6-dehydrogenase [Niallia circulans]